MSQFNIRKRDGLGRTGLFKHDGTDLRLPAATDTIALFPALGTLWNANMPVCAPAAVARQCPPAPGMMPVTLHPQLDNTAVSGDCVMVANWHTAFANPRNYVEWLVGLKMKTPADTVWYAPAAAIPSTAAILCYSGFDLFDFIGVDLKSAQGIFCTADGEFTADAMKSGICTCAGCVANDLKEHNRNALRQELALIARFIEQGQLRDLIESRCRMSANQVAIMRHLDNQYAFMDKAQPIARSGVMRANSGDSMQRVEVRRFAERVLTRYLPPKTDVAVLLPCSARKTLLTLPDAQALPDGDWRPGPRVNCHLPARSCAPGT